MPDDVVIDGRQSVNLTIEDFYKKQAYDKAYAVGQQTERVRCLKILEAVLKERPPSVPEALLRVGELIDAGD